MRRGAEFGAAPKIGERVNGKIIIIHSIKMYFLGYLGQVVTKNHLPEMKVT